jgi:hypothetical protein
MRSYWFRPHGASIAVRLRQLFELDGDAITHSSVSFDSQALINPQTRLDLSALLSHLDEIGRLSAELTAACDDEGHVRDLAGRIARELDSARHVVCLYYRQ